jgi:hypothetical protein
MIDLWFKSTGFAQTQAIITNSIDASASDYTLYIDGNQTIGFSSDANGINLTATVPTLEPNTWYNLTVTRNSGIVNIYVNGVSYNSLEFNVSNTLSGYLAIGIVPNQNQIPFAGSISDIRIVKTAVSGTDVLNSYNNGLVNYLITFQATGGTITTDGTYNYHTFTSSGTFEVVDGEGEVEVLLVGGGAGAGGNCAGGAGAGGLKTFTSSISAGTYPVLVGAGGVGSFVNYTAGENSSFLGTSVYGGGKGKGDGVVGSNGGSGGGGSASPGLLTATLGFPGQGNNGGDGQALPGGPNGGGGGGGGAATAGYSPVNGSGGHAGHGGNGLQLTEWSSATSTGVNNRYAAGGGGGAYTPYGQAGGSGGNGGGGNGAGYGDGTSGTVNTGSGAGAGSGGYASNGGNGGSGIVIVRYLI